MLDRCAKCDGKVLVAELNEEVAGFATVLAKVKSEEIEEGNIEYKGRRDSDNQHITIDAMGDFINTNIIKP